MHDRGNLVAIQDLEVLDLGEVAANRDRGPLHRLPRESDDIMRRAKRLNEPATDEPGCARHENATRAANALIRPGHSPSPNDTSTSVAIASPQPELPTSGRKVPA